MPPTTWIILAAYGSLLVELTVFPIPSEASTFQLLFRAEPEASEREASSLVRARERSILAKLFLYTLPTAVGIALFSIPLAAAFHPELIDRLLPIAALHASAFAWAGAALVVAGRVLTFASVLQLRRHKRAGALSARGLFTLSRNPGLVGMYLFYLGNALVFPCVILFIGFVPYVLNMHRRVLMEESHLARKLGADYRVYLESVPRYLSLTPARREPPR